MKPEETIDALYHAFARRDGAAMADLYHPEARFSDPVFTELRGPEVGRMWQMLCERGTDLRIEHRDVCAQGDEGTAHWEAWYTFSRTGRPVHNIVEASFRVREGLIVEHRDAFDLWRWARQALGPIGLVLGWSPLVTGKVRSQAMASLHRYAPSAEAKPRLHEHE